MIEKALVVDPTERITMEDFFNHNFVKMTPTEFAEYYETEENVTCNGQHKNHHSIS